MLKPCFALPLLAAICFFWAAACCYAQPLYNAGFRTIGNFNSDPPMRLDINVWYPTARQEHELNYLPWLVNGALNARPVEGKFPVLVVSHATPGTRFSYHELCEYFARRGFVVIAPNHGRDCMDNMDDLFTFRQLSTRVAEINHAMGMALADKELGAIMDKRRIGLAGFGSGGTAALLLGGALPACESWEDFCSAKNIREPYCSPTARQKISEACAEFPLKNSLANPQIKAMAVIAPAYGMYFGKDSFKYFYPDVLLVCAGMDLFNPPRLHCEPIARMLGRKARVLELTAADAGALMSPCPPALEEELPELCQSVPLAVKKSMHAQLAEALFSFFSRVLGEMENRNLPDPPDLAPKPQSAHESAGSGERTSPAGKKRPAARR